jgi:hypothetical protein
MIILCNFKPFQLCWPLGRISKESQESITGNITMTSSFLSIRKCVFSSDAHVAIPEQQIQLIACKERRRIFMNGVDFPRQLLSLSLVAVCHPVTRRVLPIR